MPLVSSLKRPIDTQQQHRDAYSTAPAKFPNFDQISKIESGVFEANEAASNMNFQSEIPQKLSKRGQENRSSLVQSILDRRRENQGQKSLQFASSPSVESSVRNYPLASYLDNVDQRKSMQQIYNMPLGRVDLNSYSVSDQYPPAQTYDSANSMAGLKIPSLDKNSHKISQSLERLRMLRSSNAKPIEEKLHLYSKNANMNTTLHKPKLSGPEKNFRAYVDDQVDMMSRLSVNMLKFRIDMQREQDYI